VHYTQNRFLYKFTAYPHSSAGATTTGCTA
jgi:hypothetical protein